MSDLFTQSAVIQELSAALTAAFTTYTWTQPNNDIELLLHFSVPLLSSSQSDNTGDGGEALKIVQESKSCQLIFTFQNKTEKKKSFHFSVVLRTPCTMTPKPELQTELWTVYTLTPLLNGHQGFVCWGERPGVQVCTCNDSCPTFNNMHQLTSLVTGLN